MTFAYVLLFSTVKMSVCQEFHILTSYFTVQIQIQIILGSKKFQISQEMDDTRAQLQSLDPELQVAGLYLLLQQTPELTTGEWHVSQHCPAVL